MLFCDPIYFFCLLPITAFLYWRAVAKKKYQLIVPILLVASIIFYCTWNWKFFFLLLASAAVNFIVGQQCLQKEQNKRWLYIGIAFDVFLLGYFKYFNFFIDNCNALFGTQWTFSKIILPLGISFYTFQQIAYVVDAYKHISQPCTFSQYLLFVIFFPQLVAGPIVHYQEMIPQFGAQKSVNWESMYHGLWVFLFGLFKKVMLADGLAIYVNECWANVSDLEFGGAWLASLGYILQLYFDFSGYADMAIGSGLLFGIRLPENFNSPYQALNISDLWRRWHMSLATWLKDYVYIPLGGNRGSSLRVCTNLFLTLLIGGIWHGAGWTFFTWGALSGIATVIYHIWKKTCLRCNVVFGWFLTFLFVNIAWSIFRAETLSDACTVLKKMFSPNISVDWLKENLYTVIFDCIAKTQFLSSSSINVLIQKIVKLLLIACIFPNTKQICEFLKKPKWIFSFAFLYIVIKIIFRLFDIHSVDFLYWQF